MARVRPNQPPNQPSNQQQGCDATAVPLGPPRMLSGVTNQARRWVIGIGAVLIAWYLCVLFLWALKPLTDSVPVGIVKDTNTYVSQEVKCNTLFAGSARDAAALPTLKSPLAYTRASCGVVQSHARIVFATDTVALVVLLVLLVVIALRADTLDAELAASKPIMAAG